MPLNKKNYQGYKAKEFIFDTPGIFVRVVWKASGYILDHAYRGDLCDQCGGTTPIMHGDTGSSRTYCDDCYDHKDVEVRNWKSYVIPVEYFPFRKTQPVWDRVHELLNSANEEYLEGP